MWRRLNLLKTYYLLAIITVSAAFSRPEQERYLFQMMSSSLPMQRTHPFGSKGLPPYSQAVTDHWGWKRSGSFEDPPMDPSDFGIKFGKRDPTFVDPYDFGVKFGKRNPLSMDPAEFVTKFGKRASSEFDSITDLGTRFGKRAFGSEKRVYFP